MCPTSELPIKPAGSPTARPEMSVFQVTETLLNEWRSGTYDFVACNFANLDMVGHTGVIPAAVKACEAVDACLGEVIKAVRERGGRLLLTADHGNAEQMLDFDNHPMTAHTTNPVALVLMDDGPPRRLREGRLGDIAPTLLDLWGLDAPEQMSGQSLVED
ncbi:alkaline phosphatase family protein [Desulfovibrio sp. OttesenSCG-928-G11]|nr:alkaline phosphatase family protein [Desulfovibrio sp. OttesenSCG-928-G11]